MRHTIEAKDLADWFARDELEQFACSAGAGTNKRLSITRTTHKFIVLDRGKEVYVGYDKEAAVAAYNAAP